MTSLKGRLLLTGSVVLIVFVCVSSLALERAVYSRALQAQNDKMKGLAYAVLGATEVGRAGRVTVDTSSLRVPGLFQVSSGVSAAVLTPDGTVLWQSPSLLEQPVIAEPLLDVGEWDFRRIAGGGAGADFQLLLGVDWVGDAAEDRRLVVVVSEDPAPFERQRASFRRTLWSWLIVAALALLAIQTALLRWGLEPLKRIPVELAKIQAGDQSQLSEEHPTELRPLTEALNSMLDHERARRERYRHALDDLAHSLKTPVAVLRVLIEQRGLPEGLRRRIAEQVGNVEQTLQHQLRRASAEGRKGLTQPIRVQPLVAKIVGALSKVYRDKRVAYDVDVEPSLSVQGDEGDLMELLGNLVDNATKWCRMRVRIAASSNGERTIDLVVDDDGPGFPPDAIAEVHRRGVRADSRTPGDGIGLAVVHELASVYEGDVSLEVSPWGGARVRVSLPLR